MISGCHVKPEQFFNLVYSYSGVLSTGWAGAATAAPIHYLIFPAVPAGEAYVVTSIAAMNNTRRPTVLIFYTNDGAGGSYLLKAERPAAAGEGAAWSGLVVLPAGWLIIIAYSGTVVGDSIDGAYHGSKMIVTQ